MNPLSNKSVFEGIVFDLDGTLVDTLDDIALNLSQALAECGFSTAFNRHEVRPLVGWGMNNLVSHALELRGLPPSAEERVVERLIARYARDPIGQSRPYDGICEVLSNLQHAGVPMVVFSNKTHELTQEVISLLFPDIHFEAVLGARSGIPVKPAPDALLSLFAERGYTPSSWCYLGDSGVDMATAVRGGCHPVGALWGFRDEGELVQTGAWRVISRPADFLRIVFGME